MRPGYVLSLSLTLPSIISATVFEGFLDLEDPPLIPSLDPNLLVRKIWNFDYVDNCLMMKFVPGTEQIITVHKTGKLRWYPNIDSDVEDYVELLDIAADVWSFGDHGLMSMEFHPDWEDGVTECFILYTGEPKDVSELPNNDAITPIRPPEWGLGPPGTTGYTWLDDCDNLDLTETGENRNGMICEHPYYIDRVKVDIDAGTAYVDMTLLKSACGSSSTHGPGHLMNINGDLVFGVGDGSQFTELDFGWEDDGCYDPEKPAGQGVFRAIRRDFPNGKIAVIPKELLNSEQEITNNDIVTIARGLRQPFRMFYSENTDSLTIGDVGFGDGATTERLFKIENISEIPENPSSFGWPCIEGVRSRLLGPYAILDSASEQDREEYLDEQEMKYCTSTYLAAEAFINGEDLPEGADPYWAPPIFEYRGGIIDPEYPDLCVDGYGAVSSVFHYEGENLPAEYRNKLMFFDYAKQCGWYFDVDPETGEPNTSVNPKTFFSGAGMVHLSTGPDGTLYGVDFPNARLIAFSTFGDGDNTAAPTPEPTEPVTEAPTLQPLAKQAENCFDAKEMPEFQWTRMENGDYEGTLTLDAVRLILEDGYARTFGYNGMIPGPLMRMKACGTYHLTLVNNLVDWDEGSPGPMNSYHKPTETNLHLHGLHISGLPPGDDVFPTLKAGEQKTYSYIIPCDHSSGTHWYHPHGHGSSSLQLSGGAAGLLVIEPSQVEAQDTPFAYQSFPEQYLVIQDFIPEETKLISLVAKDGLYRTNIEKPYTLINGCEDIVVDVEEGQWMKFRMLHSGALFGAIISITPRDLAAGQCDIAVLAKDGVWLSDLPRMLPLGNEMHFSHASRVDIAIKCPEAGIEHNINYFHLDDTQMVTPKVIGTVNVAPTEREAALNLPVWAPCRPNYLADMTQLTNDDIYEFIPIEVRQTINGKTFTYPDDYVFELPVNTVSLLSVQGSDAHPLHFHVNHMQISNEFDEVNNYVANWNRPGDNLDILHAPGNAMVHIKTADFIGPMVLHCHILTHEDTGMMLVSNITGEGKDAESSPIVYDYGSCPAELEGSLPYNGWPMKLPAYLQAEEYDFGDEMVAYHNVNYASLAPPIFRDEPVELIVVGDRLVVSRILKTEFLKYTVEAEQTQDFYVSLIQSSVEPAAGVQVSLWSDVGGCPPANQEEGFLGRIMFPEYVGTGDFDDFEKIYFPEPCTITQGVHTITLCFEVDSSMLLDSVAFEACPYGDCNVDRKLVADGGKM